MIRQLHTTDNDLTALSKECFNELRAIYSPNELAKKQKKSSPQNWVHYGYFNANKLIACVDISLANGQLNISSLAVNRNHRKQGIARKLISGVIDKFETAHTASIWCVQQTGNVQIFKALGFKVTQEFPSEIFTLAAGGQAIEVQLQRTIKD